MLETSIRQRLSNGSTHCFLSNEETEDTIAASDAWCVVRNGYYLKTVSNSKAPRYGKGVERKSYSEFVVNVHEATVFTKVAAQEQQGKYVSSYIQGCPAMSIKQLKETI